MNTGLFVIILGYVGVMFKNSISNCFRMLYTNYTCSITSISTNSEQYRKVNNFLISLNKESMNNNLETEEWWDRGKSNIFQSIGFGTFFFKIDTLTFCIVEKRMNDSNMSISSTIKITFFGRKRKEWVSKLRNILNIVDPNKIRCFSSIESYDCGRLIQKRDFSQVIMKDKQELINCIDFWKNNKDKHIDLGIPYKLGILLHGKPGTGKSTLGRAIASYLDYSVFYLNLRAYKNSGTLTEKLLSIPPKSVVLLEDVDCVIGDRSDGSESKDGVFSVALNFLDGVLSPDECVIIATTNYIDRLDEAFKRNGRFDVKIELGDLYEEQIVEMCNLHKVDRNIVNVREPINPSALQNILSQISLKSHYHAKEV